MQSNLLTMIATFVNVIAVLAGSFLGFMLRGKNPQRFDAAVFPACGILSIILGVRMSLQSSHILLLALSLALGGIAGTALGIENAIERLGNGMYSRFSGGKKDGAGFGKAFLDATVLFCVGAMALVGSFKAGTEGNYDLILTKSVMDGFMAILLTAALGPGVALSAIAILLYQGSLTLLAGWIKPWVSDVMLAELTAAGGALVIMIGLNLTGAKRIATANFLPAIAVAAALVFAVPYVPIL